MTTAIDLAKVRALLDEQKLSRVATSMQQGGCAPEEIMGALWELNSGLSSPLAEEEFDAFFARYVDNHRNGYIAQLTMVPMDGFMHVHYPPPGFVVAQLIPRNEVTLGGGHGGSGKSILFLALAAHVASGKAWDRFDVEQCPAVFISLEDQASHMMYRLQKIIKTYLLDASEVERNLKVFDGTVAPELMIDVNEYGTHRLVPTQMMREVEAAVAGAGLVVIDNASDAFGGNENARREVRAFIRHLAGIARQNSAAIVLLAHIDKAAARGGGSGNNYSGSTAWHNSTRSRLALLEVDGQLQLHHEKHNRSQRADPVPLMWTADGVLVPGKSGAAADARSRQLETDKNSALLAIRAAQGLGILVPAAASGPATGWDAITHLPEMEPFGRRDGKRRFHSALLFLAHAGFLIRQEFRTDQRKTRGAWELTVQGEQAAARLVE